MSALRAVWAGARLQLWLARSTPDAYMLLITSPITCLTLLLVFSVTDRSDLAPLAIVAAGVMAAFQGSFFEAGDLLTNDRRDGNLEMQLTSPSGFYNVLLGRSLATVAFSMIALLECGLVGIGWTAVTGTVVFDSISPPHAVVALVTVAVAIVGLTAPLAPLSLLTRAVRVYQNAIPWPLFLVSGVMVPVATLPIWIQPIAVLSPLYWASNLLRDLFAGQLGAPFGLGATVAVILGCIGVAVGAFCTRAVLSRVQNTAELALS